jgi:integrase
MVQVGARALKIERLTPHGLRRTFATGLWEIGTPLGQIAQMMGHEDPMITFKRYIIERPKEQAEALEKLGKLMDLEETGPSGAVRA